MIGTNLRNSRIPGGSRAGYDARVDLVRAPSGLDVRVWGHPVAPHPKSFRHVTGLLTVPADIRHSAHRARADARRTAP